MRSFEVVVLEFQTRVQRYFTNLERVQALVEISRPYARFSEESSTASRELEIHRCDELLRSAVVFLHATLDEFCKHMLRFYLLTSKGFREFDSLDLPKKLVTANRRDLTEFAKEVDKTASRRSFNNTEQLKSLMQALRIPDAFAEEEWFFDLDELMKRRHEIVHKADWADPSGKSLNQISAEQVENWQFAVRDFLNYFAGTFLLPAIPAEMLKVTAKKEPA